MATTYSLEDYKTDAEKQLKQKQTNARQAAQISYEKLKKYLPQQTAGQSLGMTETAQISASNAYLKALAEADADYAAGMADLMNNYRVEKKAEQDDIYNEIMTTIDSGSFNTTAELENYLYGAVGEDGKRSGGVIDGLNGMKRAQVEQRFNYYKANPDQVETDAEYNDAYNEDGSLKKTIVIKDGYSDISGVANTFEGNNFKINDYKVELGDPVGEGDLPSGQISSIRDGQIFGYNNNIYIKKSGTIYRVQGRKMNASGYNDLCDEFFGTNEQNGGDTEEVDNSNQSSKNIDPLNGKEIERKDARRVYYTDGTSRRIG